MEAKPILLRLSIITTVVSQRRTNPFLVHNIQSLQLT
jgi:hypothetical protein